MRAQTRPSVSQPPPIKFRDEKGNLRKELLTSDAQDYAKSFKNQDKPLTKHQIRRFYNEVKALEAKIEAESDFAKNEALVHMLRAKVAYARNKSGEGKVPEVFQDFIDNCIKEIDKAKDKEQGFCDFALFFEAIMGFADLKER